ncbi:hypothetical protein AB6A40_011767, partial [Gnathostoma spinigerum]
IPSANILFDLSYQNISKFRLMTSYYTNNYQSFVGGWQFNQISEQALTKSQVPTAQQGWAFAVNALRRFAFEFGVLNSTSHDEIKPEE